MLSATSFQITLLSGRNWQDNIQPYVLGGVFLVATAIWYPMFRLRPHIWVLSLPWVFFGLAFFMIGLPSVNSSLAPARRALSNAATCCYAIGSAAGFLFFGLNFGEEAVSVSPLFIFCNFYFIIGSCHGSLDSQGLYCSRFPTNLGRRLVVLGI
jgi:alpha-1,3-glucan synthase